MKFVGGVGVALIIGSMLQQSVTEDVNEYYWAVEAGDQLPEFESEVVLAAAGVGPGAGCADYDAEPNPDHPEGLWTYAFEGSTEQYQCKYRYEGANGFVEEYFDERQCFS